MTSEHKQRVSVIGTGRMGSALATALFRAGYPTTVWNRTASKTEPLSRLGIRVAEGLKDAVSVEIVIANLVDYATTQRLFSARDVASALAGKTLVQLASGTPREAREMEAWAKENQTFYLDGAILSYPSGVGAPDTTLFFSGPQEIFDRVKPVLSALGGNALFVGTGIGHASALDIAGINLGLGAMFAFVQGYIVCEQEGIPAAQFAQLTKGLLPVVGGILDQISQRLQKSDFAGTEATIEAFDVGPRELIEWSKDHPMDVTIALAQHGLFERAIKMGQGQADFSFLYEVLKKPH